MQVVCCCRGVDSGCELDNKEVLTVLYKELHLDHVRLALGHMTALMTCMPYCGYDTIW